MFGLRGVLAIALLGFLLGAPARPAGVCDPTNRRVRVSGVHSLPDSNGKTPGQGCPSNHAPGFVRRRNEQRMLRGRRMCCKRGTGTCPPRPVRTPQIFCGGNETLLRAPLTFDMANCRALILARRSSRWRRLLQGGQQQCAVPSAGTTKHPVCVNNVVQDRRVGGGACGNVWTSVWTGREKSAAPAAIHARHRREAGNHVAHKAAFRNCLEGTRYLKILYSQPVRKRIRSHKQ